MKFTTSRLVCALLLIVVCTTGCVSGAMFGPSTAYASEGEPAHSTITPTPAIVFDFDPSDRLVDLEDLRGPLDFAPDLAAAEVSQSNDTPHVPVQYEVHGHGIYQAPVQPTYSSYRQFSSSNRRCDRQRASYQYHQRQRCYTAGRRHRA